MGPAHAWVDFAILGPIPASGLFSGHLSEAAQDETSRSVQGGVIAPKHHGLQRPRVFPDVHITRCDIAWRLYPLGFSRAGIGVLEWQERSRTSGQSDRS